MGQPRTAHEDTRLRDDYIGGMRQLGAATCVITAGNVDGIVAGLTATAVCSVSVEPPTLLACVNAGGDTHKLIKETGRFCVNILAAEQEDLAMIFANPTRKDERNNPAYFTPLMDKQAAIQGAAASFVCRIDDAHPGNSHTIFVGQVLQTVQQDALTLLYQDGQFGTFTALD